MVATILCGSDVNRDELDFHMHHIPKSTNEIRKVEEDGVTIGLTYILRDFDHLTLADLAVRSFTRTTFNGVPVVAHVDYEEFPPAVKKRAGAKPKRGGSRLF